MDIAYPQSIRNEMRGHGTTETQLRLLWAGPTAELLPPIAPDAQSQAMANTVVLIPRPCSMCWIWI